nr:hypothetical protein Iba_scaffold69224CG0010 [Ipomoea batatas]GMD92474.1 hypothetical protein Iba_chr14eCG9470 [Ipomoea batatas]
MTLWMSDPFAPRGLCLSGPTFRSLVVGFIGSSAASTFSSVFSGSASSLVFSDGSSVGSSVTATPAFFLAFLSRSCQKYLHRASDESRFLRQLLLPLYCLLIFSDLFLSPHLLQRFFINYDPLRSRILRQICYPRDFLIVIKVVYLQGTLRGFLLPVFLLLAILVFLSFRGQGSIRLRRRSRIFLRRFLSCFHHHFGCRHIGRLRQYQRLLIRVSHPTILTQLPHIKRL